MNEEYDNTNRGAIFREYEKKSEKHPDYKGTLNVEGNNFWLSGWKRQSKNGSNYLSLSIQPKVDHGKKDTVAEVNEDKPINMDDIPF